MSYHQDWLMRQIEAITATLAYILTRKKQHAATVDEKQQTQSGGSGLTEALLALAETGHICAAEDRLFEAIEQDHPEVLEAALAFYTTINHLSDTQLEECNFSREEIKEGLEAVCTKFHLNIF